MKKTTTVALLFSVLLCPALNAQSILLDDMEGNGLCSGRWTYYAGSGATGSVIFNAANPDPSGLNTSSQVAKFTKDTTCFEYMSAGCNLFTPFDISNNSVFKMLVYCGTKDEILFKLQPGSDYTKAVYFTYKVSQVNHWEEATFNFQSVASRADFDRVEVHFMDGQVANGTLYFDLVQAPDPVGITFKDTTIAMGQEDGAVLQAQLHGAYYNDTLTATNWTAANLPAGVTIGSVARLNDTTAAVTLSGNSPVNYSKATLQLTVDGIEVDSAHAATYTTRGKVVLAGNPAWTLVYSDEFSGTGKPDPTKWKVDPRPKGWINGEQQVYTDTTHDNVWLQDGHLIIKGKKDFPNGDPAQPWSSGRVISQNKMDFLYGKVDVRARLPRARGSWPAIWLMPTVDNYGAWPKSGEIDIMEHVGNNFGTVLSTVHTQNNNWTNGGLLSDSKLIPDADTVFHVYSLEWSEDTLRFLYDSAEVYTYVNPHTDWKDWPFDKKFYVILNVAIGGGMGGSIVEADWPDSMIVDYVHIYQKGLGTPVLDSISVTPASLSFVPGKQQAFTAKAYDQNGHLMSIMPSWSITGAGNCINGQGVATLDTTGVVTATATVDSVTVSGTATVTVRPVNYKPVPALIEAEAYDNSNACCTETTQDTSGTLNVSYIGSGTWFEYDLDVPATGDYRFQFRTAMSYATSLGILSDDDTLLTVPLPGSGGWQNWITVTTAPVTLQAGEQTIRIQSNASGWNFNWLKVIDAGSVTVAAVTLAPDSAILTAGDTQQYTAAGYATDSSRIMLPAMSWFVTGAANSIDSNGLLTTGSAGTFAVTAQTPDSIAATVSVLVKPVPVLTRLEMTPDSALVPAHASWQYTVTGYDQLDSVMPVQPVWTTTGSNQVDSTGRFTAGDTPGYYLVTATVDTVSVSAVALVDYGCTVDQQYEAESASSYASGPYLQTCTDTGGGQNFAGLYAGHWFAYSNLYVPVKGVYTVRLRVSSTAAAQAKVGHSGLVFGYIDIPNTGGAWKTIEDTMTLPALSYTGIHVQSGSFKFNWFSISNCAAEPQVLTSLSVNSDTLWLENGEQAQLLATAYDAYGAVMPSPAVTWTVSGDSNQVTTAGVLTAGNLAGDYFITATAGSVTDTAVLHVTKYTCGVKNKYEAESASGRASGPALQTCTDIGGGQNFTNLVLNDWFAYNTLSVPSAGVYRVSFRVSTTAPAQIGVGHGGTIFGTVSVPNTNGEWQTVRDTMTLPVLTYSGVHVLAGTFKFNWFMIDNCVEDTSAGARVINPAVTTVPSGAGDSWLVYPNPVRDELLISPGKDRLQTIRLLDVNGQLIRQWRVTGSVGPIRKNIGFLKSGIYLLRLEGPGGAATTRLIKL